MRPTSTKGGAIGNFKQCSQCGGRGCIACWYSGTVRLLNRQPNQSATNRGVAAGRRLDQMGRDWNRAVRGFVFSAVAAFILVALIIAAIKG